MKRCRNMLVAASATLLAAACAAPPPRPMMRDSLVQKTATVESIDQASRLVTLRGEDGFARTVKVSNDVRNFPQIREGDKVVVSYYEAIAAEVKQPGEGVQGVEAGVSAARADPGKMPAASSGVMLRTTVPIESVDKESNMVTFRNADGMLRTAEIQTPEGQKFIKGLKKGDQVEIAYTEAFAIEVKPAG